MHFYLTLIPNFITDSSLALRTFELMLINAYIFLGVKCFPVGGHNATSTIVFVLSESFSEESVCMLAVCLAVPVRPEEAVYRCLASPGVFARVVLRRRHPAASEAVLGAGQDHVSGAVSESFINLTMFVSRLAEKHTHVQSKSE